jgi:carboxypeptidase D
MQLINLLVIGGLVTSVAARSARSVGKTTELPRPKFDRRDRNVQHFKRQSAPIITTEASKSEQ